MVEGFEEEAPPPPEGSMHINGKGHRPLTSPFSWGRGPGLCEIGFNDPIVNRVMHLHRVHTVCFTFYSTLRTLHPYCAQPLSHKCEGRKRKTVALYLTCCLHPAALFRSSSLPHLFEPLLPSFFPSSSASPAPLQTLSVLSLPPSFIFLQKILVT